MTPHDPYPELPIDPEAAAADLSVTPDGLLRPWRDHRDILLAIAVGGALGAAARYGLARALPHDPDQFPWSTLLTNVLGCFAIGVLMILIARRFPANRLVRPFFGTGVLGGFTTFSTYVVETRGLLAAGRPGVAAAYLFASLALGLLAVVLGLRLTERVLR